MSKNLSYNVIQNITTILHMRDAGEINLITDKRNIIVVNTLTCRNCGDIANEVLGIQFDNTSCT